MAESVTHRFSEYLRNNTQPNEDISVGNTLYDVSQESSQLAKTTEMEGCSRNRGDRRTSTTSFADLYERAVRNLLNIRPLFESPMEIVGPKSSETNYQPQISQQHQTRQYKTERDQQNEGRDVENSNSEAQSYRFATSTGTSVLQSEQIPRAPTRSPTGFFAQVLSEHSRFNFNRQNHPYLQQRQTYGSGHTDRYHPVNGQVRPGYPKGKSTANNVKGNGYGHMEYKGAGRRNDVLHEQSELCDYRDRFWHNNHKHKPSMLDDLRYHARLVLSGELAVPEKKTRHQPEPKKPEVPQIYSKEEDEKEGKDVNALIETPKVEKLTEREQLDLIRERIIKENQKLKYRPYSLRSKRNNQKTEEKKSKKNKTKRKPRIQSLWRPSTPKEIFLYQFGLMRSSKDDTVKETS